MTIQQTPERKGCVYEKKKLLSVTVIAICLAILGYSTLAYFTDASPVVHNVITSGGVDVEIVEKQTDGDPFPEEGVGGVMPGGEVSKIVTVANQENSSESWIRVWVNISISEPGNPILNPTIKNLPLTITNAAGEEIEVVTLDINSDDWTQGEDYYYYYNSPVDPGEVTTPLFESVQFAPEMGNEYQNCKVMIDIHAEAVQTANNPIPDGGDVTDIKGWPES